MIKTEFMKLYEELSELLEDQNLQEAGPYTQTLIRAYKKDLNSLCDKESLRAGINEFPFLSDESFDSYFEYIEQIFKDNGNCRYVHDDVREVPLKGRTFDAHHIIFRSLGGSNTADNLIALSREEHLAAHIKFVECLENYLSKTTDNRELLFRVLAKAARGVRILNKYNSEETTAENLLQLLRQCLAQEGTAENELNTKELINKINSINLSNAIPAMHRNKHGGSDNLSLGKNLGGDTYEVSFLEPGPEGEPKTVQVCGIAGVQKIIEERTGKKISAIQVKIRTTSSKHKENNQLPRNTHGTPVAEERFTEFKLQYPYGIYKMSDLRNHANRHTPKPLVYFPISIDGIVDYSRGQWASCPSALQNASIGLPDRAYERLDLVHDMLRTGVSPTKYFNDKKSDDQEFRDHYIFMYADKEKDIKWLQEIIDEQNLSLSTEDQIEIKIMKDDEIWYSSKDRLAA